MPSLADIIAQHTRGHQAEMQGVWNIPTTQSGNVKIQSTQQGVNTSVGVTTVDKILEFVTRIYALNKGAGYIPTTEQPQQQNYNYPVGYNPLLTGLGDSNTTGIGNKLESFITNNSTILLVIAGAFVLIQMKPLNRKNPARIVQNGLKSGARQIKGLLN